MVIPLKTLIKNFEASTLSELLASFSCSIDADIEVFLQRRAIDFENLSKSRTYLIFDSDELESGVDYLHIYGYVSLALKVLSVPPYVSNNFRKELYGFNSKIHGREISDFPCYLIGQLAKNSNISVNPITGKKLINIACDIIASAADAVGGRYMMVECRNKEKLLAFYENNSFKLVDRIPDADDAMVQMIRKI